MTDLDRVRYVTEHYDQLQGLRLIPLSVSFLVSALWRLSTPTSAVTSRMWFLGLFTTALAASYPIRAYYRRHFGDVRTPPHRSGALTLVSCSVALLWLVWVQDRMQWPVSLPMVVVAVLLTRLGLVAHRLRMHYLFVAGACLACAALGPLGVGVHVRDITFDLLTGGGLLVAGLGDDHVLRTVLRHGETDAYRAAV